MRINSLTPQNYYEIQSKANVFTTSSQASETISKHAPLSWVGHVKKHIQKKSIAIAFLGALAFFQTAQAQNLELDPISEFVFESLTKKTNLNLLASVHGLSTKRLLHSAQSPLIYDYKAYIDVQPTPPSYQALIELIKTVPLTEQQFHLLYALSDHIGIDQLNAEFTEHTQHDEQYSLALINAVKAISSHDNDQKKELANAFLEESRALINLQESTQLTVQKLLDTANTIVNEKDRLNKEQYDFDLNSSEDAFNAVDAITSAESIVYLKHLQAAKVAFNAIDKLEELQTELRPQASIITDDGDFVFFSPIRTTIAAQSAMVQESLDMLMTHYSPLAQDMIEVYQRMYFYKQISASLKYYHSGVYQTPHSTDYEAAATSLDSAMEYLIYRSAQEKGGLPDEVQQLVYQLLSDATTQTLATSNSPQLSN